MKNFSTNESTICRRLRIVSSIGLGVGLLSAASIGAAACLETGAATDLCTQSQPVGDSVIPPADLQMVTAFDPVFSAGTDASDLVVSEGAMREAPAPEAGPGGMRILPLAASGAGSLLIAGLLGLAGLNSRKRPLRFSKATPDRNQ